MDSARYLSESILKSLTEKVFGTVPEEQFLQAANIKFTLEQQMMFFARLVGQVQVADDITPIKIDNFD